tara:strand:- start:386 stop:502 length:117 start_codon:yes stop_codon:yes gene_type:complete
MFTNIRGIETMKIIDFIRIPAVSFIIGYLFGRRDAGAK